MSFQNGSGPGAMNTEAADISRSHNQDHETIVPPPGVGREAAAADAERVDRILDNLRDESWRQLEDAASLAKRIGVPFQWSGAGINFELCPACAESGAILASNYLHPDDELNRDEDGDLRPDVRWDLVRLLHPSGEVADRRCTATDVAKALVNGDLPRPVAAAAAEVRYMDQLLQWRQGQTEMPALPLSADESPGERGSRLVSATERRNRPEPDWAVDGLMPEWGVGQLFGASYTGKTYVALDLALSMANGLDTWAGREIRRPGPVVYVAMEGVFDLAARIRAWLHANEDCTDDALFTLEEEAVDLADAGSVDLLRRDMELAGIRPALIVIDTQSLATPGTDENSNSEMNRVFAQLKALASELRCPVMMVHHTGHSAQERARGASAVFAALDFQFRVSANELKAIKVKAGQQQGPWGFTIQTGEHGSAFAVIGGEGNAAVLAASARAGSDRELDERIRTFLIGREATVADVAEMLGDTAPSPSTIKRRLKKLVDAGLAEKIDGPATGSGRTPATWRLVDRDG